MLYTTMFLGYACNSLGTYFNLFVHTYSTRFRETGSFSIPKVKGFGMRSFVYNGCVLWNGLPSNIRNLQRHQQFKIAVKNHFLDSINF